MFSVFKVVYIQTPAKKEPNLYDTSKIGEFSCFIVCTDMEDAIETVRALIGEESNLSISSVTNVNSEGASMLISGAAIDMAVEFKEAQNKIFKEEQERLEIEMAGVEEEAERAIKNLRYIEES